MGDGTLRKAGRVLLAAACLVFTAACDGYIHVRGRVYTQPQHTAQSRAFVDRAPDDDLSGLVPLAGAKVTLYHGEDYEKQKKDPSTIWKQEEQSDEAGLFDIQTLTAPYKFDAALVVEKPGYRPVTQIFTHDKLEHTAVVVLVPDEQPAPAR
ncbi:MAG TPA: hypothetical protein VJ866_08100 [Pyrinomonadaceae bacterium]|nr:hypothetical protein [Pyrinomonadaceae bacterium]